MTKSEIELNKIISFSEGVALGSIINFIFAVTNGLDSKDYQNQVTVSTDLNRVKKDIEEIVEESGLLNQLERTGYTDISEMLRERLQAIYKASTLKAVQDIGISISKELRDIFNERLTKVLSQQLDTPPIRPEQAKKVNKDVLKSIQRAESHLKAGDAKSFASSMRDAIDRSIIDWYKRKVSETVPLEKDEPKINEMVNTLEKQKIIPAGTGDILKGVRSCCSSPGSHPVHYLGGLDEEERDIMFNASNILGARALIIEVYQRIETRPKT